MGEDLYTLQTQINVKSYTFYTQSLGNTGANSFLFINLELATLLIRYCSAYSKSLPYAISIVEYNKKGDFKITHYVHLMLQIDNCWFIHMPFCIAPLGKYNIIIGRK